MQVWPREQAGPLGRGQLLHTANSRGRRPWTEDTEPGDATLSLHFWVLVHTPPIACSSCGAGARVSLVFSMPTSSAGLEAQGPPLPMGSGLVLNFDSLLCDGSSRLDLWVAVMWGHSANPWPGACPGPRWVHACDAIYPVLDLSQAFHTSCFQMVEAQLGEYDSQGSRENSRVVRGGERAPITEFWPLISLCPARSSAPPRLRSPDHTQ